MVVQSGDQGIVGDKLPAFTGNVLQGQGGAGEGVEAPHPFHGAGKPGVFRGCLVCALLGGFGLSCLRLAERQEFALNFGRGDETAFKRTRGERKIRGRLRGVEMKHEIMRKAGRVDEWSAFQAKDQLRLEHAGDVFGIG